MLRKISLRVALYGLMIWKCIGDVLAMKINVIKVLTSLHRELNGQLRLTGLIFTVKLKSIFSKPNKTMLKNKKFMDKEWKLKLKVWLICGNSANEAAKKWPPSCKVKRTLNKNVKLKIFVTTSFQQAVATTIYLHL